MIRALKRGLEDAREIAVDLSRGQVCRQPDQVWIFFSHSLTHRHFRQSPFSSPPFPSLLMSAAVSSGGAVALSSVDSNVALQDLIRLQLQLQSRIATVRNAAENDLSYHAIQEHNIMIKELFSELEEKLEVCFDLAGAS